MRRSNYNYRNLDYEFSIRLGRKKTSHKLGEAPYRFQGCNQDI